MTEPTHSNKIDTTSKYTINCCVAKTAIYNIVKLNQKLSFLNNFLSYNLTSNHIVSELKQSLAESQEAFYSRTPLQNGNNEELINKVQQAVVTIKIYSLVQLLLINNKEIDNIVAELIKLQLGELDFSTFFNQKLNNKEIITEVQNLLQLIPASNNIKTLISTASFLTNNNSKLNLDDVIALLENLDIAYKDSLVNLLLITSNVEDLRVLLLGKNGILTEAAKSLARLAPDDRRARGIILNGIKSQITIVIDSAKKELAEQELQQKLLQESIDVTLPVYNIKTGGLHPITRVLEEVVTIFNSLGFKVEEGPEIEDEWYNFSALNFSEFHPAKDNHDTFYCNNINNNQNSNKKLLRTHTSNVQIRTMQNSSLPLKIIAPGKVYRSDDDATHTPMFHQIEGLYVNKTASVAELKYVLTIFCEKFFAVKNVPLRFRPSYFPFTSPSLEVDIGCKLSKNGVIIGEGNDWLEILGCGMVHPNVLKNCNINSKEYKGFAFGMGLERIAMLKYGFPDLREFFSSNYLWLKAYNFNFIRTLL